MTATLLLITAYAEALAVVLRRPAKVSAARDIRAQDLSGALTFNFQDGSHATFYYALFIHGAAAKALAVFTKHCGYFTFPEYVRVTAEGGAVLHDGLDD